MGSFRLGTCTLGRIPADRKRAKPSGYRCIIMQVITRVVSVNYFLPRLNGKMDELGICMVH